MTAPDHPHRSVTGPTPDGSWEDVLRRGRDGDAGEEVIGSVEPELAYVHLLRHARRPETMSDDDLDRVWREIDEAIAPARVPFWKRTWVRALVPVAGVAAAAFIIVRSSDPTAVATATQPEVAAEDAALVGDSAGSAGGLAPGSASAPTPERAAAAAPVDGSRDAKDAEVAAEEESAAPPSPAQILETQFKTLEPMARARVNHSVDGGRGAMRSALLGQALGQGAGGVQ